MQSKSDRNHCFAIPYLWCSVFVSVKPVRGVGFFDVSSYRHLGHLVRCQLLAHRTDSMRFSRDTSSSRYSHVSRVNSSTYGNWLVVWNISYIFHFIYGMSSFPLTNSIIFQDGYCTTNLWKFPESCCTVPGDESFRPANPRNPTAKICGRMTLKSALERQKGNGK